MLNSTTAAIFDEYASRVFVPFLQRELKFSTRVDVVWDTYLPSSLKESTREKRGKGTRRKVSGQNKIPRDFNKFLLDSANKQELMDFLSLNTPSLLRCEPGQRVFTNKTSVITIGSERQMERCNHEEADSRIVVHLKDALTESRNIKVRIRTVDTDIAAILIGKWPQFVQFGSQVWLTLGMGKHMTCRALSDIYEELGEDVCKSLPFFHAFTGCDTVSAFFWERQENYVGGLTVFSACGSSVSFCCR
eukprot:Pompholyxophrys_punicea_v1_NODE_638_length_1541_cov_7.177972.p1 type:complete len:247 gc:universal NODE_638_length_1541_cov_7.177972:1270-530(-)